MDGKPVEVGKVEVDKKQELQAIYKKVYKAMKNDKNGFPVKNLVKGAVYCASPMLRKNERVERVCIQDDKLIISTRDRTFEADHPVFSFGRSREQESDGNAIMIDDFDLFWDLFDKKHMKLIRAHVSKLVSSNIAEKLLPGEQVAKVHISTSVLECCPGKLEVVVQVQAQDASSKRKVAYPLMVL